MKKCKYCGSESDDKTTKCIHCGGQSFKNVCNNCKTVHESIRCPNCGVKAGEVAKICSNCGTHTFSAYCPQCGMSMGNLGKRSLEQTPVQIQNFNYGIQPPQPVAQAATKKKRNGFWIFVLILFLPFIGAWVVLFGQDFKPWQRNFAIIWSIFIGVSILSGATNTSSTDPMSSFVIFIICIAPVVAYFIKSSKQRKISK